MFAALGITETIKYVSIAVVAVVVGVMAWKLYSTIEENGALKAQVAVQQATIENKNRQIGLLENDIKVRDQILTERDNMIRDLYEQMDGVTDDLGDDIDDPAPKSIQELFNRLSKGKK